MVLKRLTFLDIHRCVGTDGLIHFNMGSSLLVVLLRRRFFVNEILHKVETIPIVEYF
jgi:hypothetical protein